MSNWPVNQKCGFTLYSLTVIALAMFGSFGCSNDEGSAEGASTEDAVPRYSIKAYVEGEEGREVVEFGPRVANASAVSLKTSSVPHTSAEGVRQKDQAFTVNLGEGATFEVNDSWETSPSLDDLQQLVGAHCLNEAPELVRNTFSVGNVKFSDSRYYFHDNLTSSDVFGTCDDELAVQAQALCMASTFELIAETVSPIELTSTYLSKKVTIPPQAARDRFLARRLQMEAVAAFAQLTRLTYYGDTCFYHYHKALTNSTYHFGSSPPRYEAILGRGYFPGLPTTAPATHADLIGRVIPRGRLLIEHVRSANRLLKSALEKAVDDVAGQAEALRAEGGIPAMWGADVATGPSSLRGALALLTGRLEVDRGITNGPGAVYVGANTDGGYAFHGDAACGGYVTLRDDAREQDLFDALGPAFAGRMNDTPPRTTEQQRARDLVSRLGLVVPLDKIAPQAGQPLRDLLRRQLVVHRAYSEAARVLAAEGLPPLLSYAALAGQNHPDGGKYLDVAEQLYGQVVDAEIDGLEEADIAFGLERTLDVFVQYTGTSRSAATVAASAGLSSLPLGSAQLASRNGIVISTSAERAEGLSREVLNRPVLAQVLPAFAQSTCALGPANDVIVYQNPYAAAREIRNFLTDLARDDLTTIVGNEFTHAAQGVRQEILAWAGGEGVSLMRTSPVNNTRRKVSVTLSLEAAGTLGQSGATSAISVVYGSVADAECHAGLRPLCPGTSGQAWLPVNGTATRTQSSANVTYAAEFSGQAVVDVPDRTQANQYFFVIFRDGTTPGRVLAAFRPLAVDTQKFQISAHRDGLIERVFAAGARTGRPDTCLASDSVGLPASTCIEGISSNQYVPLANELTSMNGQFEDSWQHYLGLAEEAAASADELGRQLVSQGLQRDMRREGAQEELASLCGTYQAPDLRFEDGDAIDVQSTDAELQQCMAPEKIDVMFFAEQPEDVLDTVQAVLLDNYCKKANEAGAVTSEFCTRVRAKELEQRSPGDSGTSSSKASFGFANFRTPTGTNAGELPERCDNVLYDGAVGDVSWTRDYLASLTFNANEYKALRSTETFQEDQLLVALSRFRFIEEKDGTWHLMVNGSDVYAGANDEDALSDFAGALDENNIPAYARVYPLCELVAVRRPDLPEYEGSEPEEPGVPFCSPRGTEAKRLIGNLTATIAISQKLRRMTESGIAHMAVLSGRLPEGTVHLNVPVAKMSGSPPEGPSEYRYPFTAIYGAGEFDDLGNGEFTLKSGAATFATDLRVFGTALTMRPEISGYRAALGSGMAAGANEHVGIPYGEEFRDTSMVFGSHPAAQLMRPATNGAQTFPLPAGSGALQSAGAWLEAALGKAALARPHFLAALRTGLHPVRQDLVVGGQLYSGLQERDGPDEYHDEDHGHTVWGPTLGELVPDTTPKGKGRYGIAYDWFRAQDVNDVHTWGRPDLDDCHDYQNGLRLSKKCALSEFRTLPGISCQRNGGTVTCDESGHRDWENDNNIDQNATSNYTRTLLSPSSWPPEDRVHFFLDPGKDSEQGIAGMAMLSCLAEGAKTLAVPRELPEVRNSGEMQGLRQWIDAVANGIAEKQRELFVRNVPVAVFDYVQEGGDALHSSIGQGQHGSSMVDLGNALRDVFMGFEDVAAGLRQMADAVDSAELSYANAGISRDQALSSLEISRINAIGTLVKGASQATLGFAANLVPIPNPAGAANSAVSGMTDVVTQSMVIDELSNASNLVEQGYANDIATVFEQLGQQVSGGSDSVRAGLERIREAQGRAIQALNVIESIAAQASFEAAKASGADYADLDGDGEPDVALPVNTVLRRDYDITQQRYQRALGAAKRYAYLARLSIEQKLGVRMETLSEDVGPIPAPSGWVGKLCTLTGVDYEALRQASEEESDTEETIGDFADEYVGDYVARLREFVEFYNVSYPFREEQDEVVLSLRDDLVYGDAVCAREARNLLLHSGDLSLGASGDRVASTDISEGGWTRTDCSETACVVVGSDIAWSSDNDVFGDADDEFTTLAPPFGSGGVTILTTSGPLPPDPTNPAVHPGSTIAAPGGAPAHSVYQSVFLGGDGYYTLSWWDMARDAVGGRSDVGQELSITIADESWTPIALEYFTSPATGGSDAWSARRTVQFAAPEDGYYHIVITAPADGGVAIANMQLELANGSGPTEYEGTTDTRKLPSAACGAGNPEALRASFARDCIGDVCFYELRKPIYLREATIADGTSLGNFAANNFNYRHGGVVMNVVGSGVLDCAGQDDSCYGNGYIEYDLTHTAFSAELVDYAGDARCFSFGEAGIRQGKALTAERYLGVPMSSSDRALIEQPAFLKTSLRGRPISGVYKIRIYEQPGLRWDAIEDVQLVLSHNYWSRVDAAR